jgi:hypothetical protein
MERDLIQGKVIHKPSAFNKSAAIGGLIGGHVGGITAFNMITTALAAATAIIPESGVITATMVTAEAATAASLAAVALPALAIFAAAVAIGAFVGGRKRRKKNMPKLFNSRTKKLMLNPQVLA